MILAANLEALHPNLDGRVAIVTGASRGIGKALAIRLAREGADVVVAAKSEQSSERLPGSIHETAEAVRAAGRRALAVPTDVRSEDAIRAMVEKTIAEFGRIDILVNNAGAIWTQPVVETPPKRFDLMMGVNVRAAYVTSYYCLPHMRARRWGHILNMCPKLALGPSPGRVGYMRTIIESQASINWNMADRSQWRTPEIVCDASLAIVGREPASYTGRELLDEEVLGELAGMTNFDRYWCEGKPPANPIYIDKW